MRIKLIRIAPLLILAFTTQLTHGALTTPAAGAGVLNKQLLTVVQMGSDYDSVQSLLQAKADVNARGDGNDTPLHWAWTYPASSVAIAQLLIDQRADINAQDDGGHTPLYDAVEAWDEQLATLLIEHQADITITTKEGLSALQLAEQYEKTRLAVKKQGGGGRLDFTPVRSPVKRTRFVPIKKAASSVSAREEFEIRTKRDIDTVVAASPGGRKKQLFEASKIGNSELLGRLIFLEVDINTINARGYTPLHMAAYNGQAVIVEILLGARANKEIKDKYGRTPLDLALFKGRTEVVEMLREPSYSAGDGA